MQWEKLNLSIICIYLKICMHIYILKHKTLLKRELNLQLICIFTRVFHIIVVKNKIDLYLVNSIYI